MTDKNKEDFLLPPFPESNGKFVPPPLPKKPKLQNKNLYIIAGGVLAAVVICVTAAVIISNNRPNDYIDNSYSSTISQPKEGEVGLRDSNGSEYTAQIDGDYYSSLGAESSRTYSGYYDNGYSSQSRYEDDRSDNSYSDRNYTSSTVSEPETTRNNSEYNSGYTSSISSENNSYAVSSEPENEYKIGNTITFSKRSWLVLDVQDNKALIISVHQSYKPYDDTPYYYSRKEEPYTWEISYLRKYLNGEYYNNFTIPERNRILTVDLVNEDNSDWGSEGGNNTQDKIFVLSASEMLKYCDTITEFKNKLSLKWGPYGWLRTPGRYPNRTTATYFFMRDNNNNSYFYLKINYEGVDPRKEESINPAMWIKTE